MPAVQIHSDDIFVRKIIDTVVIDKKYSFFATSQYHEWTFENHITFCNFRADCSKADVPGNTPEHNGLTQFGRVRFHSL